MNYEKNSRLTILPKEILTKILSLLPTKFAVATAILSTSWRYLWTQITTLRFTITDFPELKLNAIILFIMRRVSWRHINTIELIFNGDPNALAPTSSESVVHDIIYNGINVKELKVNFKKSGSSIISVPSSIFKKPSLKVLVVYANDGFSIGKVDVNDKHPNLRKLVISIREYDLKSFENLLKSSPLLEILRVGVQVLDKFNGPIKINAQNLKYLSVNLVCDEECTIDKNKIVVDTPKLLDFQLHSTCRVELCFLKTPTGLSKAKLFMGDGQPFFLKHVLMSVFNPIFRVKTLKLSGDLLLALVNPHFKVKVFHNLSHLETGLSYNQSWSSVKCFLKQCPNIETRVLKRTYRAKLDHLNWSEFKFLPRCLHNKIKSIELWNFGGSDFVLPILGYIFTVAKALKKLHITIQNNGESKKIDISKELMLLSKKLPSCEINVLLFKDGENIWEPGA